MNNIKLRAWDKVDCCMGDVVAVNWAEETVTLQPDNTGAIKATICPTCKSEILPYEATKKITRSFEQVIPLRFTGLYDRRGRGIYEGHVIKSQDGELYHVGYARTQFYLRKRGSNRRSTFGIAERGAVVGSTYGGVPE